MASDTIPKNRRESAHTPLVIPATIAELDKLPGIHGGSACRRHGGAIMSDTVTPIRPDAKVPKRNPRKKIQGLLLSEPTDAGGFDSTSLLLSLSGVCEALDRMAGESYSVGDSDLLCRLALASRTLSRMAVDRMVQW